MRRRAAEFRRRARWRFYSWIACLLAPFIVAALILFVLHRMQQEHFEPQIRPQEREAIKDNQYVNVNYTVEFTSATSFARQLSEQIALAKAYLVLAKEHNDLHFAWQLSSQIHSSQLLLSKAAMRGKSLTLSEARPIIERLSSLLYRAQDNHYDLATTIVTLKNHIHALEERTHVAAAQSAAFGQLAAEAVPRNLHCLNVKLALHWLREPKLQEIADEQKFSPRLVDNNLYHFCIFSDNVMAASAVINSTVVNAAHPKQLVFHIVTDEVNFLAIRSWFLVNDFKGATVEVQNLAALTWMNATYFPVMKQIKEGITSMYSSGTYDPKVEGKFTNHKYVSFLNHLRFYIPDIYPTLEKVVLLDDDVIVQKDLTPLFSLDLHGNVIGVVETCLEAHHRYYKYLNFSKPIISSHFDPQACAWAFGMNVIDLIAWRKANVTTRYCYWQEQNTDRTLWRTGTLPVGLLVFYGLTEPLDRRWHVLGLGYDATVDDRLIESAAVLHYNGNMKPWTKLGIERYKPLWEHYVNHAHPFIIRCWKH